MRRKPKRVLLAERLNDLARDFVGDGNVPDVFFVTDRGDVVTVTYDATVAYDHWRSLASRRPLIESALESRKVGVVASVEPISDLKGAPLAIFDERELVEELR